MDLPFYITFPTGIYLFKINNKNRKKKQEALKKLTKDNWIINKLLSLFFLRKKTKKQYQKSK